jgi:DNA-binding beta-propeller fold protein YncE
MKRTDLILLTLAAVAVWLLARCTQEVAGNGSDVGNAAVGVVYDFDGAPAPGATVKLVPVGADPRAPASVAATVVTDQAGRYSVSNLAAASYNVLADKQGRRGLVDSAVVRDNGVDTLPDAHLAATGSLAGVVKLMGEPVGASVYLLVLGTTSYASADTSGRFTLADMAGGSYRVRVLTTVTGYGPKDTVLALRSGFADTLGDTIWINSSVIPVPTGVRIQYDTMMQIVTLRWDACDTAKVKSYNVYRRNVSADSVAVRINAASIRQLLFVDSGAAQDTLYEYRVCGIDAGGVEGGRSADTRVTPVSAYRLLRTLGNGTGSGPAQFQGAYGIVVSDAGRLYCTDRGGNRVIVLDTTGAQVAAWGSPGSADGQFNGPSGIALDSAGNVYVADDFNSRMQKFTSDGVFVLKWGQPRADQAGLWRPFAVATRGNAVYVGDGDSRDGRLQEYDLQGSYTATLSPGDLVSTFQGLCADDSILFAVRSTETGEWILAYGADGALLGTRWTSPVNANGYARLHLRGLAVQKSSGLLYAAGGQDGRDRAFAITRDGQMVGRWLMQDAPEGICVRDQTVFVLVYTGYVRVYVAQRRF